MITGPKPAPTAIKALLGNPGKRALNDDTIKVPPASEVKPPMPLYGPASREWVRITPHLHSLGLLTDLDLTMLAAYCESWGRYCDAQAEVSEHGILIEGYRGGLVKNPAAQLVRDAFSDMIRLALEFGMTPSSRGRMTIPGSDNESEDDGLDGILS